MESIRLAQTLSIAVREVELVGGADGPAEGLRKTRALIEKYG